MTFVKGHKINNGRKVSEATKEKISIKLRKGLEIGYRAIHLWVERHLGKPRICEKCGNRGLKHRQYQWANISGKYKKLLSDWVRLCAKCHAKIDGNRGRKPKAN